jgi:DNA (cytosine-5)-methyltransferase 1
MKVLHISLFSGIGGFDIAAHEAVWETAMTCETDDFCNTVLEYWFPYAYHHRDIKTLTNETIDAELTRRFGDWRKYTIILSGGFPCQPYSLAGLRKGKEDARHLWPEMYRIIQFIKPTWVVGENVYGIVNWNGGLVFDEVQTDLEAEGYEVQPVLLPACGVDAPHERTRTWFVAYANQIGWNKRRSDCDGKIKNKEERSDLFIESERFSEIGIIADSDKLNDNLPGFRTGQTSQQQTSKIFGDSTHSNGIGLRGESDGLRSAGFFNKTGEGNDWQNFPTQSPICSGNDGLSLGLSGITFSKWRQQSIKALGNAVVPQVPYQIFKVINKMINN